MIALLIFLPFGLQGCDSARAEEFTQFAERKQTRRLLAFKAAVQQGQKSLLNLPSVSRLARNLRAKLHNSFLSAKCLSFL